MSDVDDTDLMTWAYDRVDELEAEVRRLREELELSRLRTIEYGSQARVAALEEAAKMAERYQYGQLVADAIRALKDKKP